MATCEFTLLEADWCACHRCKPTERPKRRVRRERGPRATISPDPHAIKFAKLASGAWCIACDTPRAPQCQCQRDAIAEERLPEVWEFGKKATSLAMKRASLRAIRGIVTAQGVAGQNARGRQPGVTVITDMLAEARKEFGIVSKPLTTRIEVDDYPPVLGSGQPITR